MKWASKSLSEVVVFRGGGTPSKATAKYWTGDIPWVSSKDLKSDLIFTSADKITAEAIKNSSASMLPEGAVLMVTRSGILKRTIPIGLTMRQLTVNQDLKALCVREGTSPKFLFYFLKASEPFLLSRVTRSATVHRLQADIIKNLQIPVPPLPEQERIVSILDEAFEGIATATAHAERNLHNARELFQSVLQSTFEQKGEGWVETTLKDVCGITAKLADPKDDAFIDLLHVGGANIESNTGKLIELKTAREEGLISGKFPFDQSMVLYSKIRPYLMKVARPDFEGLCSADIYPLSPKNGVLDRDFLFHALLTEGFTDYAIQGSGRAGMPKVNRTHLFAYRIAIPPLDEQKAIVQKLDALASETRRLEAVYQRKLDALAELKQSLLQRAFAGEL